MTLSQAGEKLAATLTDAFGDFKFDGLQPNSSLYEVLARGDAGEAHAQVTLEESVVLDPLTLR